MSNSNEPTGVKKKGQTYIPPAKDVNFQVVWSGARGTVPSLVLQASSANKTYVFNCGEGFQRLCTQVWDGCNLYMGYINCKVFYY